MRRLRPLLLAVVTLLAALAVSWLVLVDGREPVPPELGPAVHVRFDTATSRAPGPSGTSPSSGAATVPRHAAAPAGDDQDDEDDLDDLDDERDRPEVDD